MAAIIAPASQSAASLFGMVTTSANVVTSTITTIGRGVDMLDIKAKDLHSSIIADSAVNRTIYIEELIQDRALDLTDRREQRYIRLNGNRDGFDRNAAYNEIVATLTKALEDEAAARK